MALASAAAIVASPVPGAAATGGVEDRVVVPLQARNFAVDAVGSATVMGQHEGSIYVALTPERPGDAYLMPLPGRPDMPGVFVPVNFLRMLFDPWEWEAQTGANGLSDPTSAKLTAALCAGEGSGIRFSDTFPIGRLVVTGDRVSRLCFRRSGGEWVYVCGRGQVKHTGGTVELGDKRTVDSCLDLLTSSDPIFREGGARDLGRLATSDDVERVVPRLAALLQDGVTSVRRGAAEGLGLIGRRECVDALKAAAATEKDEITGKFIAEALALCAGTVLIGEPSAPQLSTAEAAKLYTEGRTWWTDEMLARRIKARGPGALQSLLAHAESGDTSERLAAAQLLGNADCVEAAEVLGRLSREDPDENVRRAAREAGRNLLER